MIHLRFSTWIIHCSLPDIDACVQCMFLGLLFHLLMRFRFLHNNMEIFQGPNSNIKCCFQRENFWFHLWKSLAYTQNGSFRNSFLWPSYIIQWTQGCFQWVNLWFHLLKSLACTQNINFRNSTTVTKLHYQVKTVDKTKFLSLWFALFRIWNWKSCQSCNLLTVHGD